MPIPTQHHIKVVKSTNLDFPFTVRCSCQWEALAASPEGAKYFAGVHSGSQRNRGNVVTIDIEALKPISVDEAK